MTGWALLGYAAVLSLPVAALLRRAAWTSRAPRLAMFTWFSLAASALLALVSAGILLVVPATGLHRGPLGFIGACLKALEYHYGLVGGSLLGGLGGFLALGLPLLLAACGLAEFVRLRRGRHRHLRGLAATARLDGDTGALVLDHDTAAAYCLPGRRGGVIVVTTGAMRAVDDRGLAAVLRHERAHLAGRHHLLTGLANALHRPLCFLPLFAALPDEIARLVELRADDVASAGGGRRLLAASLLAFAESRLVGASVATGSGTLAFAAPGTRERRRPALGRPGPIPATSGRRHALAFAASIPVGHRVPSAERPGANPAAAHRGRMPSPGPILAASGADTVDRMRRLVSAPARLNRSGSIGIAAGSTAAMLLPVVVTVVSLATVTYMACCSS